MSQSLKDVYITRVSGFLPHAPVTNEEMEARLGLVDGKTSRARAIVLRNNGIVKRYYAMDAHGKATHTNAALAAEAVKRLAHGGVRVEDFEVLACGTSAPTSCCLRMPAKCMDCCHTPWRSFRRAVPVQVECTLSSSGT